MKKYMLSGIATHAILAILVGVFAGVKWGIGVFVVLTALGLFLYYYEMGKQSIGPWGHLAVTPIVKKYDPEKCKGEVIFYGPSNFTLWKDMDEDLKPFIVQNHGIGGTTDTLMMKYAEELVFQYEPSVVFFQTGSNDYSMGCTVEQVKENKKKMYAMFRERLPEAKLCVMAGLFVPARPQYWSQIQEVNEFLKDYCAQYDNMMFVDGNAPLRNPDGSGKEELYRKDRLHLNHEGELAWAQSMRPVLKQIHAPVYQTKEEN